MSQTDASAAPLAPVVVTPIARVAELGDHEVVLVSWEAWPDRVVVRTAAPSAVSDDDVRFGGRRFVLLRGSSIVARVFSSGGGYRGGLNVRELHFRPVVEFERPLSVAEVDEADRPLGQVASLL